MENQEFLLKHSQELSMKYPKKYVAIVDNKLVSVNNSAVNAFKEAKKRVEQYLKEGFITRDKDAKFTQFFLNNAKNSLESAKLLFEASVNEKLKNAFGLSKFNGFLWVINSSYYSMFYTAYGKLFL